MLLPLRNQLNPLAFRPDVIDLLLNDSFDSDAAAPLTSPRTAVPGPGTLTIVDTLSRLSAVSGEIVPSGASVGNNNPGMYVATGYARVAGRALLARIKRVSAYGADANKLISPAVVWSSTPGSILISTMYGLCFGSSTVTMLTFPDSASLSLGGIVNSDFLYNIGIVMRNSGIFIYMKGGVLADWTLLWADKAISTSPMYPQISSISADRHSPGIDFMRVADLGGPFHDDYGIASFNQTSSVLSAGSDLILDGAFTTWVTDNPSGWTVTETAPDPEVTERAPANGHADAVGAGGAANFFSSATNIRPLIAKASPIIPSAGVYMIETNITKFVSGTIQVQLGSNVQDTYTVAGIKRTYAAVNAAAQISFFGITPPINMTMDATTAKKLTLNPAQTMKADSIIDFEFTLPGAPIAGQEVGFCYRIAAAGEELYNCWYLNLRRNSGNTAWDIRLDIVSAGVRSNSQIVTGVGTPDTLRVITNGDKHDFYTAAANVFTKRGATTVHDTFRQATLCNTVYDPAATFGRFVAYPRRSNDYEVLSIVRNKPPINYLIDEEFLTDGAAPLAASRASEPGPGLLKKSADSSNLVNLVSSKLDFFGAAAVNFVDPSYYLTNNAGAGLARVAGRAMVTQIEFKGNTSRGFMWGWSNNIIPALGRLFPGTYFAAGAGIASTGTANPAIGPAWTIGLYNFVHVLLASGGYTFAKGGAFGAAWRLIWYDDTNADATMYPIFAGVSTSDAEVDYARVTDLVAPFIAARGLATVDDATLASLDTFVGNADGIHDFRFTLPGSPPAGDEVVLNYRRQDSSNYWKAYLKRNVGNTAWDFLLDSVVAGTPINRISVTGVGTPTVIRVTSHGLLHDCYTLAGTSWTKRGGQISNSTHQTQTGLEIVAVAGTTLTRVEDYPSSTTVITNTLEAL